MSQHGIWSARCGASELRQEPNVVSVKLSNIGDPVTSHAEPLNPKSERKTRKHLGIVANGSQNIGVDHAGSPELDPAVVPVHIGFDAWLGERKERRAKPNMHIFAQ